MAISKIVTNSVDSGVTLTSPVMNTITSASATALTLQSAGTTAITVDTSQNVGIGTTSPANKLDVFGDSVRSVARASTTAGEVLIEAQASNYWSGTTYTGTSLRQSGSTATGTYAGLSNANLGSLVFQNGSAGLIATNGATPIVLATTSTERMRIDSSGNLLVGTTSSSGKLSSTSTSTTQAPISANSPASFTTANYASNSLTAAGTGWFHFYGVSSNNTVQNVIIYGNGNIQNANNSYGALSDIKIKENIIDTTPKLADLCKVQIRNFNLKKDPEVKQIGVIAQELEAIFPSMIDETLDRDAEGNGIGTTTKSVKYSVFVPMLIKAIQEQQALIIQLQADVAALKGIK